jgi:arylformamidase
MVLAPYSILMQVVDLTHSLETGMPVFPGSEPVVFLKTADLESTGYNEMSIHLSTHTGTHIDCGRHLIKNSFDTGNTSPDRFYGKGLVIDCQRLMPGEFISKLYLQSFENNLKKAEFVLFHTGWSRFWGSPEYFSGFPVPDHEAAQYLTKFSLKGAGIDAISFDPLKSKDLPVHKVLLSHPVVLIENLTNIQKLPNEGFIFCCFPLKIKDGDGSPVRAVGIVNGRNSNEK